MNQVRAFTLRIHEKAQLTSNEFDDRLELKLINTTTGKTSQRTYCKLEEGVTMNEAVKIDTIIYHMHNEIGLNLWESN
jgi:hypothetical protein